MSVLKNIIRQLHAFYFIIRGKFFCLKSEHDTSYPEEPKNIFKIYFSAPLLLPPKGNGGVDDELFMLIVDR